MLFADTSDAVSRDLACCSKSGRVCGLDCALFLSLHLQQASRAFNNQCQRGAVACYTDDCASFCMRGVLIGVWVFGCLMLKSLRMTKAR